MSKKKSYKIDGVCSTQISQNSRDPALTVSRKMLPFLKVPCEFSQKNTGDDKHVQQGGNKKTAKVLLCPDIEY